MCVRVCVVVGIAGTLFNRIQLRILNPKAVTMGQLYGEADKATQEWKDGVLGTAFRYATHIHTNTHTHTHTHPYIYAPRRRA